MAPGVDVLLVVCLACAHVAMTPTDVQLAREGCLFFSGQAAAVAPIRPLSGAGTSVAAQQV